MAITVCHMHAPADMINFDPHMPYGALDWPMNRYFKAEDQKDALKKLTAKRKWWSQQQPGSHVDKAQPAQVMPGPAYLWDVCSACTKQACMCASV